MDVYLADAARTPFGRRGGVVARLHVAQLAAIPLQQLLLRNPLLADVDHTEIYLGADITAESGPNLARSAALISGLSEHFPAITIDRRESSGLDALILAARAVRLEDSHSAVAAAVGSASRVGFQLNTPDTAYPTHLRLFPSGSEEHVGQLLPSAWRHGPGWFAQLAAYQYDIDRAAQDGWALHSHSLAHQAWQDGIPQDHMSVVDGHCSDECILTEIDSRTMGAQPPLFTTDGTITVGNSAVDADGAAALLVSSFPGPDPMARFIGGETVGVAPNEYPLASAAAIRKVLARHNLKASDIAAWEIEERYAAATLVCLAQMPELGKKLVNTAGSTISYGHAGPASALRSLINLCTVLRRRGGGYGVAATNVAAGQGMAVIVRVDG
ncbi:thiolase family protein [Natronoglycomyces albus]|uniref:Probable acetyl-CoA acetyltransferase n=1 Tax=Natronoglycomyces albus TaxID=2811108 RepID=A0A895XGP9_9ACTN|nr:thiolase family protein [Natronoglycomyces albus]QSB05031.1 thiolase family protein [Natronoglycomyces albus]